MTGNHDDHTRNVYERHAAGFDRSRSKTLFEKPWLDRLCAIIPARGSILDIGCGTGRPIAGYLVGKGYDVTGIDYARPMLDIAAARFPSAAWVHADMRDFDLQRTFDAVIAWHSFFHLSPEEQRRCLPVLARHVTASGALMITIGPDTEAEATGTIEGEPVYHASLPEADYRQLLTSSDMEIVSLDRDRDDCGGATILIARKAG
ncbi:class I SAM-dependent methyltransferase [Aquisalinus flavus]|uniref:Methyltransferase n=1 Tax=Aquisalinus flavus TaxID=1526572 RepID=A0A8J2V1R7_9PROT|nr:class I SAM-dependent methyltransferase [Aquisalinus flavus]MBD0427766.1 methyltransferase domain-containing protein [Aquisalinus flavus]UNE47540.1 methyltransferase domain-containing protein [Aquisalinus flavus]GGD03670.1 methyltransferase [Aquisalinus flavus]